MSERKKSGGWSSHGTLITNDTSKTVSMQAVFPEADNYTVEFGLTPPDPAQATNPTVTEALIFWSVEGNTLSRRINVGNGASITGTGQGVKIVVQDKTPAIAAATPLPYDVSIQVTKGTRGGNKQPPTLSFIDPTLGHIFIVPGANRLIAVPQDAGVISALVTVGDTTSVAILDQMAEVRHEFGAITLKQYDPHAPCGGDWIPLTPGTTGLRLFNQAASGTNMIFSVTFGIDG